MCRKTAEIIVDIFLKDKRLVGIGNGPLTEQLIECIAEKRKLQPMEGLRFVPATDTASVEAAVHGLPVAELEQVQQVGDACLLPTPQPSLLQVYGAMVR